ncbi:MAG: nucleoside deaminase [Rhodospirillales bacterium]
MGENRFMREAIELACANVRSGKGGPFAALVVKDGAVVGCGVNLVTSTNDPTAHAEIVAIREACRELATFQLAGCEIYTTCEPCPMCMGAIYWARPSKVWFAATRADAARAGFDDAFIYEQLCLKPEERAIPAERLMSEQGLAPFDEWARKTDKIRY